MNSAHLTLWILGVCNGGAISLGPARRGKEEQIKHKGGKEIKAASSHPAPLSPSMCVYTVYVNIKHDGEELFLGMRM